MSKFLLMDIEEQTIQEKKFLCIFLYETRTHNIFRIYKLYDSKLFDNLKNFKNFQDITERITYVIKRDGKVSLDIKF